jgi:hypothetical protein
VPGEALAHGIAAGDKGYIQCTTGIRLIPFAYLGAKHMVTGYDHLLFLLGVIFFLYRLKDVGLYVTLFAVGHSVTLLTGVLTGVGVNAYLIDAIIGLSVVYKAMDNLNLFRKWFGVQPSTKAATLIFGLYHGFGLATKILDFEVAPVRYAWSAGGGAVSFEAHGDTLNASPGVFHSYKKGRGATADTGAFVAVFDGQHGWFWRNRTREVVTITLRTEGEYRALKRLE